MCSCLLRRCVYQRPDDDGRIGVSLSKDLVHVASHAMQENMTLMGPYVLPFTEQLLFAVNWLCRRMFRRSVKPYVPDFKRAFQHFCLHAGGHFSILAASLCAPSVYCGAPVMHSQVIYFLHLAAREDMSLTIHRLQDQAPSSFGSTHHCVGPFMASLTESWGACAGGRGVVEGLSRQLDLTAEQTAPSAATLERYGNTSSSTVWYSLGFIESCQHVARGDIVWQVGFGSGFKCNSAVWKALTDVHETHNSWAHRDCTPTKQAKASRQ